MGPNKMKLIAGLLVALLMVSAGIALAAPLQRGDCPSTLLHPNHKTIAGTPLEIHVGDNASVQVYHDDIREFRRR